MRSYSKEGKQIRYKKWQPMVWFLVTVWFAILLRQKTVYFDQSIIWIIVYSLGVESAFINWLISLCSRKRVGKLLKCAEERAELEGWIDADNLEKELLMDVHRFENDNSAHKELIEETKQIEQ